METNSIDRFWMFDLKRKIADQEGADAKALKTED